MNRYVKGSDGVVHDMHTQMVALPSSNNVSPRYTKSEIKFPKNLQYSESTMRDSL
jgi:hypothetical protein